ncbi:class I SAM-dependent methyltransferase [Sphingomonas profundi]|uniref:class I SAM-dependent methyltransferase n=1 Tax=Alterirhizorhabdus profundi TaxID=2681549 RepID=UPI0012E6F7C4|nr:class I SAM-dependent methyltransferase [Sphingomonas profundi]
MLPLPPEDLRFNVAGTRDPVLFDTLGALSVQNFAMALAGIGRSLPQFARILEWGCGCGRILRHLPFHPHAQELHGCDIDPKGIAWLRDNLPYLHVQHTPGLPPLPYADGHFDLIINHSVLSHLDEAYQDAWLAELGRVLAPGGVLMLTVHGPFAFDHWTSVLPKDDAALQRVVTGAREALAKDGFYFLVDDVWADNFPSFYQSSFHTPAYVFSHWGRFFDIMSYIPRGALGHQDMIVLRHKATAPEAVEATEAPRDAPTPLPARAA